MAMSGPNSMPGILGKLKRNILDASHLMKARYTRYVTEADLHYEGSISIDRTLIEAAGFLINERVDSIISTPGHVFRPT